MCLPISRELSPISPLFGCGSSWRLRGPGGVSGDSGIGDADPEMWPPISRELSPISPLRVVVLPGGSEGPEAFPEITSGVSNFYRKRRVKSMIGCRHMPRGKLSGRFVFLKGLGSLNATGAITPQSIVARARSGFLMYIATTTHVWT